MNRPKRLALDGALLLGFLIAANPSMTGLSLHEWLGLAIAVPALFHLIINWEWVIRVVRTAIAKVRATSRLNFVVDLALFVLAVAVTLSGVLVLPGVASALGASTVWYRVHSAASNATVVVLLAHFALHWRWMWRVLRDLVVPSPTGRPARAYAQVERTATCVDRPYRRRGGHL